MAFEFNLLRTAGLFACSLLTITSYAFELSKFGDAVINGKPILNLRYRYETVDQNNALQNAKASTLRTRFGYATDSSRAVSFVIEGENITSAGTDKYNSTTNGQGSFSVVADPETTEVNQAFLKLTLDKTVLSVGRQRMVFDNGRFLGDVGFRQNQQTYDAAVIKNTTFDGHRFMYAYMDKAHRFLGDDHPVGNFDMSSHFFNYNYKFLNDSQLSLYAYLLEMETPTLIGRSTRTIGGRFQGGRSMGKSHISYTLEFANQSPYSYGDSANRASYAMTVLGLRFPNLWQLSAGVEYLGGDGNYAFQTPLATAHAFDGFADIFAGGTPPNGLIDRHLKVSAPIEGVNVYLAYHDFISDNSDLDYGTEWDLVVSRGFGKRVKAGIQYSSYSADQFAVDTDKGWFWLEFKY